MKRLLILAVFGMLLGSAAGCRFWDCLWHGPAYQQPCPPAVTCPSPCGSSCGPCEAGVSVPAVAPAVPVVAPAVAVPGPEAYVPPAR
jgi:hypothetical protein